jgi:hypothetical protein
MATSGGDDRRKRLKDLPEAQQSNVVSELRAIQRHAEPVDKAHEWAENLLCLRYQASSDYCFRKIYNCGLEQNFVAVSWTRRPSAREDLNSGKYPVVFPCEDKVGKTVIQRDTLDIRDSVLEIVVSYLEARRMDTLWTDIACIDQANPDKKAEAINSMDLVYKNAIKSLGLLTTPIYTSTGAHLLGLLLDGDLSYKDNSDNFHIWQNTRDAAVIKVIRILQDLVTDIWWERAWIYQEKYLSGLRMDLLILLRPSVQVPECYDPIPGEFCVQATKFREQVSIFLLACSAIKWKRYHAPYFAMLKTVRKYSITLRRSDGALKPMSATIFADIQRRAVENAWDTLAITTNTCAYRTKLNVQGLVWERRSLSLCLLAQFLLNDEIFTCSSSKKGAGRSSLQHKINALLHRIQPRLDDLPISTRELFSNVVDYLRSGFAAGLGNFWLHMGTTEALNHPH